MFIIAAMLVNFSANAQKKFTYGIKGGVNVAEITNLWSNNENQNEIVFEGMDQKVFPVVGVFAEWRLASFFAVAPELLYSGQGVGAPTQSTSILDGLLKIDSKMSLSYINVPVMLKLYPFKWLSVDMGPQAGFLVAAKTKFKAKVEVGGETTTETETIDSKSYMKTMDFSVGVGLTFNFSKHIFFQPRYNIGLSEILKNPSDLNDDKHNNRVIQFSFGYRL